MDTRMTALIVFAICTLATVYLEVKNKDCGPYSWGAIVSIIVAIYPESLS